MSTAEEIVVRLRADGRALDANLTAGERRIQRFSKKTEQTGRTMSRNLTLPIVAATAASAKMALEFDHQFALIGGLVGASAKQLEKYKTRVLEMAPALGKAPAELAEALYFVTSSGFKGAAALRVLEASAKASAAGLGSTAVVADAVTSAVNAYGEETLSATHATDILLAAVREGKSEPEAFAGSIGRVIPIAEKMGVSFGEVAGMMAAMSLNGTNADEAVTQLSAVLATAIKPTKEGADMLKSIGKSYADVRAEIKEKGLLTTIKDLNDAYGGNVEKLGAVFGNVRALRGILALTGASAEKYKGIIEDVGAANGDTAKAFGKMAKTDMFKLQQSWAELQKVAIEFGAVAVPAIVDLVEAGTNLVEWIDGLDDSGKKTVLTLAAFVAVLGPALSLVGKMGTGVTVLMKAYRLLAGTTAAATAAQTAFSATSGGVKGATVKGSMGYALAQRAAPLAGGGGTAAAAAGGGAAAAIAPIAMIAVAAALPFALMKAQKNVDSTMDAAEKRALGSVGGGAFFGSSKGYQAGSGRGRGLAAKASEEAIGNLTQKLTVEISTAKSLEELRKLTRQLDILKRASEAHIDLGGLAEKTPVQLEAIRLDLQRTLDIGRQKATELMEAVAGKKLKFTVVPPKMAASEKALQNFLVLARRKGDMTAKQWETAIMAMGPAGGKAGAAAAAAMLAKLNTLPAKAAAIAAQIAANLARGVSSATSATQLQLEKLSIKLENDQAEGGSYLLSGPTPFLAGEAGPEVAAFFPLNDPARSADVFADLTTQLAGVLPSVSKARGGAGAPAVASAASAVPDVYVFIGDEQVAARVELHQAAKARRATALTGAWT